MRADRARVDDSEVQSVPSSSVRHSENQRKHKDQTVLQVVLEAQLRANFTGDVLFCSWWGGFPLPLLTVHMEVDGKGLSEWVREWDRSQRGCGRDSRRAPALPFCLDQSVCGLWRFFDSST